MGELINYKDGDSITIYIDSACGSDHKYAARISKIGEDHFYLGDESSLSSEEEVLKWIFNHSPSHICIATYTGDEEAKKIYKILCELESYRKMISLEVFPYKLQLYS